MNCYGDDCEFKGVVGRDMVMKRIPGLIAGTMKQYRAYCAGCAVNLEKRRDDYRNAKGV